MVLNKRISIAICIVSLLHLIGIDAYSRLCDNVSDEIAFTIYWGVDFLKGSVIIFLASYLFLNRYARVILRASAIFGSIINVFQILGANHIQVDEIYWLWICPSYILTLTLYLYVTRRIYE